MFEGVGWQLLLIFVLIVVNGFFALAEIALVTVRPTQIASLIEGGVRGARRVKRLTQDSSRFLSTIQVAITLSGFLASASATATLARPLGDVLIGLGAAPAWSGWFAVFLVTAVVSYLSLVLGELVPKQLALHYPKTLALRVARPVELLGLLLGPFVMILSLSTRFVLKLFRIPQGETRSGISEDELRRLVVEHRALEEEEKEMIESVFQFGDALVREVMVPRADVEALKTETPLKEAAMLIRTTGFSRFPVYEDDLDEISGIVTAKDVLSALLEGKSDATVGEFVRRTVFVPETKHALTLLQELRQQRIHMAVVVDEYGSTAGIVTIEDLLEEIVGEIQDETDPEPRHRIVSQGENEFLIDAGVRVEEINELLKLELEADDTYETLAGYLLSRFQHIPEKGETLEDGSLRFTVEETEGNRIERVRLTRMENPGAD